MHQQQIVIGDSKYVNNTRDQANVNLNMLIHDVMHTDCTASEKKRRIELENIQQGPVNIDSQVPRFSIYRKYTGRMPFLPPNQRRQSTEGIYLFIVNTEATVK